MCCQRTTLNELAFQITRFWKTPAWGETEADEMIKEMKM